MAGCGGQQHRAAGAGPVWCPSHVVHFAQLWPREARAIRRFAAREGSNAPRLLQINGALLQREASIRRFDASRLIGWEGRRARRFALGRGCEWRVVMRDGGRPILTQDLRTDRVDVDLSHGRVTGIQVY